VYSGGERNNPKTQLWVRKLNELRATALDGTEGAMNPAFSPDGQRIAFLATKPLRSLRVIPVTGGPSITLTDSLVDLGGISWSEDGYIYYDGKLTGDGLARIRAAGGKPEIATVPDSTRRETYHLNPSALPDGRGVLFSVAHSGGLEEFEVGVRDAKTGAHTILVRGVLGRYSPSGHLIYVTASGAMMAAPFDLKSLRITGEAIAVSEGVSVRALTRAEVEVSASGTLVYAAGSAGASLFELAWLTPDNRLVSVDSTFTGRFTALRVSPEGKQAALIRMQGGKTALLIKQLDRGPATKIADGVTGVVWAPDGRSLYIITPRGLEHVPADGSRVPQLISSKILATSGSAVSPDGKWFVYSGAGRISAYSFSDSTIRPLITSPGAVRPAISPDGRWLTYSSDMTGRWEVYVVPFPDVEAAKHQVTTSTGGLGGRWTPDGKTLYFAQEGGEALLSAPVTIGEKFSSGSSRRLATLTVGSGMFDPASNGRVLVTRGVNEGPVRSDELILVVNFAEELKAKRKSK
jgi:Tol biopolymer transport system component